MTGPGGSATVLVMDGQARRRRPWPRLAPEVADGLLGLAVVAAQLLLLSLGVNQGGPVPFAELNGLAVALILLQGLPLTWRRRRPLLVFGVVLAANTAYYAIGFPPSQFDFGLPLAVFTVAAERDRRTSLAALAGVLGLVAVQWPPPGRRRPVRLPVAQEALTNSLKHAGPAQAELTIRYGPDTLEVTATDTGHGPPGADGTGNGLVGMRERVSLFGGQLEAGPAPQSGFRVAARFPLDRGPQ